MRDFIWQETEPLTAKRFRSFVKRTRCAVSLISEIAVDARFRLYGKRYHWPGSDFAYLEMQSMRDVANFGHHVR